MMMIFGYFALTCFKNSGAVRPSPRVQSVQSMEMISDSASMHSSTSRMVMVIRPVYPGYSRLMRPMTGRPVSSLIPTISRTELVRIIFAPACLAARAISGITERSLSYSGSPGVAWQETIIVSFIKANSSSLVMVVPSLMC